MHQAPCDHAGGPKGVAGGGAHPSNGGAAAAAAAAAVAGLSILRGESPAAAMLLGSPLDVFAEQQTYATSGGSGNGIDGAGGIHPGGISPHFGLSGVHLGGYMLQPPGHHLDLLQQQYPGASLTPRPELSEEDLNQMLMAVGILGSRCELFLFGGSRLKLMRGALWKRVLENSGPEP